MYALELAKADRIRIIIRVNYGFYVVERILLRCMNKEVKDILSNEVLRNLSYSGGNSLKQKWQELIEKYKSGLLWKVSG